jgi:hypothetical protein
VQDQEVSPPLWQGALHIIGQYKHVLPLYEDDRLHQLEPECICKPDVVDIWGEDQLLYHVHTHHLLASQ